MAAPGHFDAFASTVCSAGDEPLDGLSECETLAASSGALTWKRCKDNDDNTVIVGFAEGSNNKGQDVYASCTYTTNTVACAADDDACTQDVCSAGVCEKDFDINLLDGDVNDDATTCPTKAQLVALITSVDLDTTCLDDINTNVCFAGDEPLHGLSECETLTASSGALTWKRCKDNDDNTVIVGFAVGPNNEDQDVYASCTYTTNTAACAADADACTQDVCSAGVCGKDFDINLLDGDVDDDATTCPTKAALAALITSVDLDTTCLDQITTDVCSAGDEPLDGLSECETLTAESGDLTWKRCQDGDGNSVIVGYATGENNKGQDVYASCTYTTNTAACAADADACTQDVCSAGVCEKDFDINLLDGDVDDDATSCPTKSELIDLIGSIALSSTCFSGPSADECTPGGNALVGLSDCETLTLANGQSSGLTWKRCIDADSNKVIVGYATGTNNKGQATHATCTYTTNTDVCSADSDACTQDVCGGGVCAKSYDADLRDGDLDAGPDSCPAASALSAVLPNLVSSCVALDGSTACSAVADGSPTAGYTGCVALSGSLGGLSWKRCADADGKAVVLGSKQLYNNLGAWGAQQVWGRCVYRTTGATCSSAQCADQVCSRANDATLGTCGTVPKNTGSLCNTNVNSPYGGVFTGSNIGGCVDGKCLSGPCKSDTAWAMPTLAQFQSAGGSYSAIKDFTTSTPGVTGGRVRWWTFAGNNKWGGYFIFNDTSTLTTITVDIRGGAAQNDPTKGWLVGSVKLTYTPGARTVTFEGQFASTDHYATSVSLLTTYDSNVGQNGISTGSPGQLSSWTTYSPAWTSSPAYGNGIFGAERAAWTFTASPNSAKPGSGKIMAGLHFDAKDLICNFNSP